MSLSKGSAYRLAVTWTPHTTAPVVNLHVRNGLTGAFRVVGSLAMPGRRLGQRTDTVDFAVADEGFTQFALGAVHFTGPDAGAEIARLTVQEIAPEEVRPAKDPAKGAPRPGQKPGQKPGPGAKGARPAERELAEALALKDNAQYLAHYARGAAPSGLVAARARMMFHAHAIEKGLSRSDFRPGFGKIAVPGLAQEMNGWLAAGRDTADPFFRSAAAVMQTYFGRHAEVQADVSDFHALFAPAVHEVIAQAERAEGGVLSATADREAAPPVDTGRGFLDVVYGRRSVRDFIDRPVRTEDIRHAVQIAMQAPSVCNRQAARVHLFDDPEAIKAALDLQGGFGGYRMPPRLLLVTSDLSAFLFATERNQPFIDGGLFMMTLLLGLQQMGLGSCSLNTAMSAEREAAIRRILKIPENEVFIAFVAVGHYDGTILTPQSRRVPVDAVLVSHLTATGA
jgi:nitroreductase